MAYSGYMYVKLFRLSILVQQACVGVACVFKKLLEVVMSKDPFTVKICSVLGQYCDNTVHMVLKFPHPIAPV